MGRGEILGKIMRGEALYEEPKVDIVGNINGRSYSKDVVMQAIEDWHHQQVMGSWEGQDNIFPISRWREFMYFVGSEYRNEFFCLTFAIMHETPDRDRILPGSMIEYESGLLMEVLRVEAERLNKSQPIYEYNNIQTRGIAHGWSDLYIRCYGYTERSLLYANPIW